MGLKRKFRHNLNYLNKEINKNIGLKNMKSWKEVKKEMEKAVKEARENGSIDDTTGFIYKKAKELVKNYDNRTILNIAKDKPEIATHVPNRISIRKPIDGLKDNLQSELCSFGYKVNKENKEKRR